MLISENPFFILGATTRDNKQRLIELYEEKSLIGYSDECSQALAILTNPRKRLSAEFAWLPGFSTEQIDTLLKTSLSMLHNVIAVFFSDNFKDLIERDNDLLENYYDEASIAELNIILFSIFKMNLDDFRAYIRSDIFELVYKFKLFPYAIVEIINNDRLKAGLRQVDDLSLIEEEFNNLKIYIRKVISAKFDLFSIEELSETIGIILLKNANYHEHYPILDVILDYYELRTKQELDEKFNKIIRWINIIRKDATNRQFDENPYITLANTKIFNNLPFPEKIEGLCQLVKKWDCIAQPMQLNAQAKGVMHQESEDIAYTVRDLAVKLYNEYNLLEMSLKLTNMLKEAFSELDIFLELLENDIESLDDIAKQYDENQNRERWEKKQYEIMKQKNKMNIGYTVTILGDHFSVPNFCTCCMIETDEKETISSSASDTIGNVKRTRKFSLDFPLCSKCKIHKKEMKNKKWTLNLIASVIVTIAAFFLYAGGYISDAWIVLGVAFIAFITFGMVLKTGILGSEHSCKEDSVFVSSLSLSYNMVTFTFSNWLYAQIFATGNGELKVEEVKSRNGTNSNSLLLSLAHPIKNAIFVLVLSGILLMASSWIYEANNTSTYQNSSGTNTNNYYSPSTSSKKPSTSLFNEPVVSLPQNGYVRNFTDLQRIAPFNIKTPYGDDYYYILLKNTSTNKTVISIFVYPGRTVEIEVPIGNFYMYYATGKTWYGTTHLFGPGTSYSKANDVFNFYITGNSVMGHTVELIKQSAGNLSITNADKNQFKE